MKGFVSKFPAHAGSYSDPGTPAWTFSATGAGAILTVTDSGEAGDICCECSPPSHLLGESASTGLVAM